MNRSFSFLTFNASVGNAPNRSPLLRVEFIDIFDNRLNKSQDREGYTGKNDLVQYPKTSFIEIAVFPVFYLVK